MKLTSSWLKQWVQYTLATTELAEQLTLAGLETTIHTSHITPFTNVIVGEIIEVTPHPSADRLNICTVDCGKSHPLKNIVCGGVNVRKGLKVATALIGAKLPNNFLIKSRTIRGISSDGMLCSVTELNLQDIFPNQEIPKGIWELPTTLGLGIDIWNLLKGDEPILAVQVPPNRGDCLSVRGLAREISLLNSLNFLDTKPSYVPPVHQDKMPIHVIDQSACPHYTGRIIRNINPNAALPWWLLIRLKQGGIRSVNSIVDVINYVLLEWGTPLHAFDLHQLKEEICVRAAHPQETIHLLNNQVVSLKESTLVVADQNGPIAIAGVMGSLPTGVTTNTVDIFLESAHFDPQAIIGEARKYNLMTESSYRFERGVDPKLCHTALEKATDLLLSICKGDPGPIVSISHAQSQVKTPRIELQAKDINKVLGITLPDQVIEEHLTKLGTLPINQTSKNQCDALDDMTKTWHITSPSWRFDINASVDLIEELARLTGYDAIPNKLPAFSVCVQPQDLRRKRLIRWKEFITNQGYHEVINYSFVSQGHQKALDPDRIPISLTNPLSKDLEMMRTQLLSGLLMNVQRNQHYRLDSYRFFESGTVFIQHQQKITEQLHIAGVITGTITPEQWGTSNREVSFFDLKGTLHRSLHLLDPEGHYTYLQGKHPALHQGQTSQLYRNGIPAGWIGALHPKLYDHFKLTGPIFLFECAVCNETKNIIQHFKPFARFPYIKRDMAFWISKQIPFEEIKQTILSAAGPYLQDLNLFDLYCTQQKPEQRSIALSLLWQHPKKTLLDHEVEHWQEKIIQKLKSLWKIDIRH